MFISIIYIIIFNALSLICFIFIIIIYLYLTYGVLKNNTIHSILAGNYLKLKIRKLKKAGA